MAGDLCPYCHSPVREIVPEVKPPPAASPKKTAKPVKPWVAPKGEESKPDEPKPSPKTGQAEKNVPRKIRVQWDRQLILKNVWASLLVALAAGLLVIQLSMCRPSETTGERQFSFRWLDFSLALVGGFAVMLFVRWCGECRPDSRLWRWVERELRMASIVAIFAGLAGFALGLMVGYGDPGRGLPDAPVWGSSIAWLGVIISWVIRLVKKGRTDGHEHSTRSSHSSHEARPEKKHRESDSSACGSLFDDYEKSQSANDKKPEEPKPDESKLENQPGHKPG